MFALDIDNVVGAECEPDLEAVVARAGESDRRGAKSLCHRDAEKSDRSGPGDDHALAGDEPPNSVNPYIAVPAVTTSVASSSDMLSGIATSVLMLLTWYSQKPPSVVKPLARWPLSTSP